MRRALIAFFIAALALPAWSQEAPPVRIVGGYVTGKGYMDMDGLEKRASTLS